MAIEVTQKMLGTLPVATVTLDHGKVNVIDRTHCELLVDALATLRQEDRVRVIVLRGAGRCFSTGVDISEHTPALMPGLLVAFHGVFHELLKARAMTIAAIHGYCLGGAAELAFACDRRCTTHKAQIGFPEISVGCYPPVAIPLMTSLVGPSRATQMIMSGKPVSVETLMAAGAIDRATDDLDAALTDELEQYADKSPAVIGMIAALLHEQGRRTWGNQIGPLEQSYLEELLPHPDAAEGVAAFTEKRPPRWLAP